MNRRKEERKKLLNAMIRDANDIPLRQAARRITSLFQKNDTSPSRSDVSAATIFNTLNKKKSGKRQDRKHPEFNAMLREANDVPLENARRRVASLVTPTQKKRHHDTLDAMLDNISNANVQKFTNILTVNEDQSSRSQAPDTASVVRRRFGQYTLRPHQVDACAVMNRRHRKGLLLYYDMGSGKTLTALASAVHLIYQGDIERVIVACPVAVKDQFEKQLQGMDVPSLVDKFTITSHQSLKKYPVRPKTMLILDEVHLLRGEGIDFKHALKASYVATKVLALTGTPLINWPSDIAPIMALVNFQITYDLVTAGGEWDVFIRQHPRIDPYQYVVDRMAQTDKHKLDHVPFTVKPSNAFRKQFMMDNMLSLDDEHKRQLFQYLKCNIMYYAPDKTGDQYLDQYPSSTVYRKYVPMTYTQSMYQINAVKRELASLKAIFGVNKIEQLMTYFSKLRIHGNFSYDETFWASYPDPIDSLQDFIEQTQKTGTKLHDIDVPLPPYKPKLDAIMDTTEAYVSRGQKVMIYTYYKTTVHSILRTMLRQRGIAFGSIDSDIKVADRDNVKDQYNTGMISVLLLSSSGQVGLDLKNTSAVIIVEPDWNESNIQQVMARAIRSGSHDGSVPRHVDVYRYVSTLDPSVLSPGSAQVMGNKSADEHLQYISDKKMAQNNRMLTYMRNISRYTVKACEHHVPYNQRNFES